MNITVNQIQKHHKIEARHRSDFGSYLSDMIFGASDGIVTTFAIVAGAIGANFPTTVIIILGFANLLADGISMALGNYIGKKSERDFNRGQRQQEEWEIENMREAEIKEVKDSLQAWGFTGQDLKRATETIISDKKRWVDFMMREELNIFEEGAGAPSRHGLATFFAFSIAGLAPIIPYLTPWPSFGASITSACITLFIIGALKNLITPKKWYVSGLEMLIVGVLAGSSAYFVGNILEHIIMK
ncbi:MAG: hypothetical protein COT81_05700 [Candidatus Buchananbacteria bacterium CG10_big_fil_rev_8_21_14_0_10_42_9]|uniref:GMP synthase n=1 Tax=Candidatus Buchananbacteria bacterium CG10_big_fil_rev_8_21_14_0_10_42_9 TaxID=1974526 RepID=A0A2H0VZN7_9BACT|nr:MAG: hypothetical protein COT81_05700 [Candidatus Buchananbacteria bacterium CG10_big_fil_rev_8_21_14_0_10_42_9]